ncbi:MAG: hypothetical protein J6V74_01670 [Bacteroidales bacterium]|nr:hypothetical protein [Bacteroidales bacterium]
MNKKQLKQYLDNPELLSASDIKKLADLVDDYPYFQTARMLYAKGLQNTESDKFDTVIELTATYAVDRKKLFAFIPIPDTTVTTTAEQVEEVVEETEQVVEETEQLIEEVQ